MTENNPENQPPKWVIGSLPLFSIVLGSSTLWIAWSRYNSLVNRQEFYWYDWIQPVGMVFAGSLCLLAAILSITDKTSAWSIFKAGLSIVPLIFFINLVILVLRIVQSIIQGNAISFISRLYVSPLNKAILAVVVIIILLSMVKEMRNHN